MTVKTWPVAVIAALSAVLTTAPSVGTETPTASEKCGESLRQQYLAGTAWWTPEGLPVSCRRVDRIQLEALKTRAER